METSIVDLRGFILRAYHSGTDPDALSDNEGNTVNTALYGFEQFFERFLPQFLEYSPPYRTIFVKEGGNQLRKDMFDGYKRGRGDDVCELEKQQLEKLETSVVNILARMGFLLVKQDGLEADDVIAYLSQQLGGQKFIYTVDKDLAALSTPEDVTVTYHGMKNIEVFYGEVDGAPAKYVSLQKSLCGDKSDKYLGIKGFGSTKWDYLVSEYGTEVLEELERYVSTEAFDELKQDAEDLNDKVLQMMYDKRDEWRLGWSLAQMYPQLCNRPVGRKMHSLEWTKKVPDAKAYESLIELLEDGEAEILELLESMKPEYALVTEENFIDVVERYQELLKETEFVAWDYEAWDPEQNQDLREASGNKDFVDVLAQKVTGVSVAVGEFGSKVYYFSLFHKDTVNIPEELFREVIKDLQEAPGKLVAQNAFFESVVTKTNFPDVELAPQLDTALFSRNLFEEERSNLKIMSAKHLEYKQATYKETVGDRAGMHELTGLEVLNYGCDDSIVTSHLYYLFSVLAEIEGTRSFVENEESVAASVLVDAFIEGDPIDLERLEELRDADAALVEKNMGKVRELLTEHCTLPSRQNALDFYKADKEYHKAYAASKGTKYDEYRLKKQTQFEAESIYVPFSEVPKLEEFIPTPTKIKKVLLALGEEVELKAVTNKAISELSMEMFDKPNVSEFMKLLNACTGGPLKSRKGDEYDKLVKYCTPYMISGSVEKVGTELNPDSPNQMQFLLYCLLGLPVRIRTKKQHGSFRDSAGVPGSPATNDIAVATALAEDCSEAPWKREVLELYSEANAANTRRKFYWEKWPLWASRDGRLHPSFTAAATVTNRNTGSQPNLLQVSKGPVRSVLKSPPGYKYVSIDFASQELRILADECKDPVMMSAYLGENKKDLHSMAACAAILLYTNKARTDIDTSSWTLNEKGNHLDYDFFRQHLKDNESVLQDYFSEMRGKGKTVNFGSCFSISAASLGQKLLISEDMAELLIDSVLGSYVRFGPWKEEVVEEAKKLGYVEAPFGTRRHLFSDLVSKENWKKSSAERMAVNFKAQGAASEVLKVALTNAVRDEVFIHEGVKYVASVYDEIVARVKDDHIPEYWEKMKKAMSITPKGRTIPQVPELGINQSWAFPVELGDNPSDAEIIAVIEDINGGG